MSDNSLVTGWLAGSIAGAQVGRALDSAGREIERQADKREMHDAKARGDSAERAKQDLGRKLQNKNIEIAALKRENNELKDLLAQPFDEIAKKNPEFAENLQILNEMIEEWIVSQHAFRELASQYGTQLNKSAEQISADALKEKENVIKNTTKYGNNLS